ncbi:MAG TPA: ATP-binding protein [Edaphobacter sp.]|jgi:signal transduction histidine kinase
MDLIERLTHHKTLGPASRKELTWLAEHAEFRSFEAGEIVSHKGEPVEGLYVILSGRLALFVDRGGSPSKMVEWTGGDVTGMLPFSRLGSAPANSVVQESLEMLVLHRDCLRELTRECFEITSILVHRMLDRTRLFTSNELHDEKMISLGKLSAGLAHELNNPAAAIERSVCLLTDRLEDSENAARILKAARLTDEQLAAVDAIRASCMAKRSVGVRSPLEQIDREDAIAEWLAKHRLDGAIAPVLAETEVTLDDLNVLARTVPGPALNQVLRWTAAGCAVRGLAAEIQGCSTRISSLVIAIKGFTHMDQGVAADLVHPGKGLADAVTVLHAKATQKTISVGLDIEEGLPQVNGYAAELNQIWGILIDNALDAAAEDGQVMVSARGEGGRVVVRIVDNGVGIPAEIQSRIFDPFFTTKPMGQGTGLGLDIARRLVQHNEGFIEFSSQAGRTEFRVSIPAAKP